MMGEEEKNMTSSARVQTFTTNTPQELQQRLNAFGEVENVIATQVHQNKNQVDGRHEWVAFVWYKTR